MVAKSVFYTAMLAALLFSSLCYGTEHEQAKLPQFQQGTKESPRMQMDPAIPSNPQDLAQMMTMQISAQPTEDNKPVASLIRDQLQQKSPVNLWVPGRGAVGVRFELTW